MVFTLSSRAERMNSSVIREILKDSEKPGIISLAGGLPSVDTFPVEALRQATARVLETSPREALQYSSSEGYAPLREWIAARLNRHHGMSVSPAQVLITSGSQQGLDLAGKILIDRDARVLVEAPTYPGALQALAPYGARMESLGSDQDGPLPDAFAAAAPGARVAYVLPNFQNPTGRLYTEQRRMELVDAARAAALPLVEDDPYGELWFEAPAPCPLASLWPEGVLYLGSFSKVLVPGLRLGYVVAPAALYPKLLQAKQATDLHTAIFNQRVVYELLKTGFLDGHLAGVREHYRHKRDIIVSALERHMSGLATWSVPAGGLFIWLTLRCEADTMALLPRAINAGVAYVPGAAFYCVGQRSRCLRLSFATASPVQIEIGIATLARVLSGVINA